MNAAVRTLVAALLGALALAAAALPATLPAAALDTAPALRPLGSGEMRWLGFRLYDAQLWVSGTAYQPDQPHALALRYHRGISAARLVDTSVDEMRRLGAADEAQLLRWRAALQQAFPDVAAEEVIVGLHLPGGGAAFWHQGRLTARIDDAEFARLFFAIWLDPRTREPGLRARLLGAGAAR